MNNTSKVLLLCLLAVGAWIGAQQLLSKAPAADTACAQSGGG